MSGPCLAGDAAKLAEAINSHTKPFVMKIEQALQGGSKYIVGDKISMVDFWTLALWTDKINNPNHPPNFKPCWAWVEKECPKFVEWAKRCEAELQEHLRSRPAAPF